MHFQVARADFLPVFDVRQTGSCRIEVEVCLEAGGKLDRADRATGPRKEEGVEKLTFSKLAMARET